MDFSYKNNNRLVAYDIESLNGIWTNTIYSNENCICMVFVDDCYSSDVTEETFSKPLADYIKDHPQYCNQNVDVKVLLYTKDNLKKLSFDIRRILYAQSIVDGAPCEYYGYNSFNYDLPFLAMILHVLKANKTITASDLRTLSNAIVNAHTSIYKLFESVESYLNHIDVDLTFNADKAKALFNQAIYTDKHIDASKLINKGIPNSLKFEMAKAGMDVIIDDDVAESGEVTGGVNGMYNLVYYNLNDVIGTNYLMLSNKSKSELSLRDYIRDVRPYTSARYSKMDIASKYMPLPRDVELFRLAEVVVNGGFTIKVKDYEGISYNFAVNGKKVDLLDYMSEHESYLHPLMYDWFDYWRGKNMASKEDFTNIQKDNPVTRQGQMFIPYFDGQRKPTRAYCRPSLGGNHGGIINALEWLTDSEIENLITSCGRSYSDDVVVASNVFHVDWHSFYPTLAKKLGIYNIGDKNYYNELVDNRLSKVEQLKDKSPSSYTEDDEKIAKEARYDKDFINIVTGASNRHYEYSKLPLDNAITSMRLIGNLLMWCLLQRFAEAGAIIYSTNTDGGYFDGISRETAQKIIDAYVAEYDMPIDLDTVDCFISRDTSNRIEIYSDYIVVAGELNAPRIGCSKEKYVGTNFVYPQIVTDTALNCVLLKNTLTDYGLAQDYVLTEISKQYKQLEQSKDLTPWYTIVKNRSKEKVLFDGNQVQKVNRVCFVKDGKRISLLRTDADTFKESDKEKLTKIAQSIGTVYKDYSIAKYDSETKNPGEYICGIRDVTSVDVFADAEEVCITTNLKWDTLGTNKEVGYPNMEDAFIQIVNTDKEMKSFDISNLDLKFYIDQTMTLVKRWCVTQSNDTKSYTLEDLYTNALDTIRRRSYVTA